MCAARTLRWSGSSRGGSTVSYELARPPAHAMIESLRGVGYSIETAIADLVDNSVAAGARNVRLDFAFDGPESRIAIVDDGRGMDAVALRDAMTVGGRSPLEPRALSDLGRFGMGLKTASFSQCRSLTVASRPAGGALNVRRWDLDYIAQPDVNEWRLLTGPAPGSEAHLALLDGEQSGTVVLWERLDRITAGLGRDRRSKDAFLALAARVEQHLAMVFHRYLEGPQPRLRIRFEGGERIRPWDPFMGDHQATYRTPLERIRSASGEVLLQGYVLPHRDQLTQEAYDRGGGRAGWTSQQGFYVYRNDRLLVAGGWLGLGEPRVWTREEPFKLARIAVSFPNSADAEWEVDIRKAAARPPRALRPRLTDLAAVVRAEARRVFAHRGSYGKKAAIADLTPAWLHAGDGEAARYRINRAHPLVAEIGSRLGNDPAFEQLLRLVEVTVPVQRIWLDAVEKGQIGEGPEQEAPEELVSMAATLYRHLTERVGLPPELARQRLMATEPFHNHPTIITRLESNAPGPEA